MAATCEEVDGKLPVVAGIIANSTREAILRARDVEDLDIAALQTAPLPYPFKPDEQATLDQLQDPRRVGGAAAGFYLQRHPLELPQPRPAAAHHLREIPGVIGVKQSQGDLKLMADLLLDVPEGKLVFTAVDALLYPSFTLAHRRPIAATPPPSPGPAWRCGTRSSGATTPPGCGCIPRCARFWNAIVGDNTCQPG